MRFVPLGTVVCRTVCLMLACSIGSAQADTIYVNAATGNDSWDGLCSVWDGDTCGPVRSLERGIGIADNGDTVSIAPGTYTSGGSPGSDTVFIMSEGGPGTTIVDGGHIPLGTGDNSSVSGLSFINDASITTSLNQQVSNCIMKDTSVISAHGNSTVTGCTIDATSLYDGIRARDNTRVVQCTFSRASGGIDAADNVVIVDCTMVGNTSPVSLSGQALLSHCDLSASESAAVYATENSTIDTCYIHDGTSGGIQIDQQATVTGSTIRNNSGTGVYATGSGTITSCQIIGNGNNTIDGGGIRCELGSSVTITDTTVSFNTGRVGGGIAVFDGQVTISNCQLVDNFADRGGGVYMHSGGTISGTPVLRNTAILGAGFAGIGQIADCDFSNNIGPGVDLEGGVIQDCNVSGNSAQGAGAAGITAWGGATVLRCTITGNTSDEVGGVNLSDGAHMEDCTVTNNTSTFEVGGVWCGGDGTTIVNCEISNNQAQQAAGGLKFQGGGMPTVSYCRIMNNQAGNRSGGISVQGASPRMYNCLVAGNSSNDSAAVEHGSDGGISGALFVNCTFADNHCPNNAAISSDVYKPTLINCVLANDARTEVSFSSGGAPEITYSCVASGWPGRGNVQANPRFVNRASGDYRPSAGSMLIDAGDNNALPGTFTTDLLGLNRHAEDTGMPDTGTGDTAIVDMGAYEFQGTTSQFVLTHPVPGLAGRQNMLQVAGAAPGATVYIGYGFRPGNTVVPLCGGLIVNISSPSLGGEIRADGAGVGELVRAVPGKASGQNVLIQAVDADGCAVSELFGYWFP